MSDTDSVVLVKPLPDHLVGVNLGQLKLEQEIKKGVFIRKKLYYIENHNSEKIIKASGIDSSKLNYDSFKKLLEGESIEIERTSFNVEWKTLNISVVSSNLIVQGLKESVKTIYNTPDVNFKYVSFPIKYSIIIHPLHLTKPVEIKSKENLTLNENKD